MDPPIRPYFVEGVRRSDLTPDDWVFVNPLAPASVVEGDAPADYVIRGKPSYWIVDLTPDSAKRLVGMDLIYLSAPVLDLTRREQDGLRAAVEAGAVLWIDNAIERDAAGDPIGATVFGGFPWQIVFGYDAANIHALEPVDAAHELLRAPHALNTAAVRRLGDRPNRDEYDLWQGTEPDSTLSEGHFLEYIGAEFRVIIENVAYDDDGNEAGRAAWAAYADYGAGSVLVTTGGVGRDVVEWLFEGDTGAADWRPSPNFLQQPDVKFALNAVQWKDRWQQARGTQRAGATSVARAPYPLDIAWQYPDGSEDPMVNAIGAVVSTPVHSRNLLYALSLPSVDANVPAYLMAFDMTPEEDRTGDGMPDDGVPDYAFGAPYDMIWRVDLPLEMNPHYASPTLTSYADPGGSLSSTSDDIIYPQVVLISYANTADGTAWVDCYDGSILGGGALLWRREIEAYSPTAQVVGLSSPIVHNGYVYVLASEYDETLSGVADANSTYGRAHCFELDYAWDPSDPWPTDASWWVYPSALDNIDGVGTGSGPELQRSLPAFLDPAWVANPARPPLPPAPGPTPVVHAAANAVDGVLVDALLTFGTPTSLRWNGSAIVNAGNRGGSQYTLVPAPMREDDHSPAKPGYGSLALPWGAGLNHDYFAVRLNEGITAYTETRTQAGNALVDQEAWDDTDPDPDAESRRYLRFSPASAREAAVDAFVGGADPLVAQLGVDVNVRYNEPALTEPEGHRIPGPVRWKRVFEVGERISQPAAMSADEIAVTSGRSINHAFLTPPPAPPTGSGAIAKLDAASGATRWSYDPSITMPGRTDAALGANTTAAAFDDETVIVGTSAVDYNPLAPSVVSSIVGLQRQVDAQVNLGLGGGGEYPVAVYLVRPSDTAGLPQIDEIAPGAYNVDPWMGRLIFPPDSAADIVDADGFALGEPIYGKVVRVVWDEAATIVEDHVVPDIERFHHTPGFIRLRHRPFDANSVSITRPDGTAILGADSVSAWVEFGYGTGLRNAILDGWIDLTLATDADGAPVLPGDALHVSYSGWSERYQTWVDVPNAANNIAVERHQMAVEFGPSLSSPAVAGDTIHLGTQGMDYDLDGQFDPPPGNPERRETFLSLLWNRATGLVRSAKIQPARRQVGIPGIPVVSGAPSIAEDRVFVGSRLMTTADADLIGPGYVSALAPWRVLICDTNRIIETTGSEPSWVCTGTSSPQRTQAFIGEDLQRPFSRPAKATRLQNGTILVVDSGNHRVVEIDRAGRVVWPLDMFGYEYYTSPDNRDLKLSRPADAHRYYEYETGPLTGRRLLVLHTVIADTGNARVIDIETRFHHPETEVPDGRQRHTVNVLTPTYVRTGTTERGYDRVRYISAIPLRDPDNDAVIGYLCAASNLNQLLVVMAGNRVVNPFAGVTTPGGSGATWAYWAWLYDADPTDGENVSNQPLQFENIKNVDLRRIGDTIHVAVTATRYLGRSGEDLHPLAAEGAGVFEFRIDVSAADPADWALHEMGTGADWPTADPHWFFVGRQYKGRPMTTISTDAGDYDKRWYPVSSQRLSGDTVLITNSLSLIESATHENIGAGVRDTVMGSHIFEVETNDQGDGDPTNDTHWLNPERSIPAPGTMWTDPFTQPAHARISR